MTQADALRLFVIAVVWSVISVVFYFVMIRPAAYREAREGRAFLARSCRGLSLLMIVSVASLGVFTFIYGYQGLLGALLLLILLHGLANWDHSTFYPEYVRRSLRWMAAAHVPYLLGILGGWADHMGWMDFPYLAFYALITMSAAGFAYVAALPIRKPKASKRSNIRV